MSRLKAEQKPDPSLGLAFPTFVLERPVEQLDARIALRTDLMLDQGWIEETEEALRHHEAGCPGLLSIGYREIVSYLAGNLDRAGLATQIVQVTRQYAKRQRTWFRHIPWAGRGSPDDPALMEKIVESISSGRVGPDR